MYTVNKYGPLYGASAIAGNRFLYSLFAVAFPLFVIQSECPKDLPFPPSFSWVHPFSWCASQKPPLSRPCGFQMFSD